MHRLGENAGKSHSSRTVAIHSCVKNESIFILFVQLTFNLTGIRDGQSELTECICATNPLCHSSTHIYDSSFLVTVFLNMPWIYTLSDLVERCSATDSLLFSTLECFYLHSDCFPLLANAAYIAQRTYMVPSIFYIRPLVYDATASRFPPHTSIKTIVEKLMIEQWNPAFSYEDFYHACAPRYCTYSQHTRLKTTVQVMIALVSMIGGLIASLRVLTPYLGRIILYLWARISQQQRAREPKAISGQQGNHGVFFTIRTDRFLRCS